MYTIELVLLQRYMAQWWAKLAASEKDYREGAGQVERASRSRDGQAAASLAEGGSWYLEALALLAEETEDRGKAAIDRIRQQLAEANSEGCGSNTLCTIAG